MLLVLAPKSHSFKHHYVKELKSTQKKCDFVSAIETCWIEYHRMSNLSMSAQHKTSTSHITFPHDVTSLLPLSTTLVPFAQFC